MFLIFSILFIITCRHRACPPPRIFQQLPVPWSGQDSGSPLLHHLGPFLSESTSGTSVATPSSINQSDPDGPDVDSLNDEHHLGILAAGNVVEGCHQSNDGDSDAAGNDDSDADYLLLLLMLLLKTIVTTTMTATTRMTMMSPIMTVLMVHWVVHGVLMVLLLMLLKTIVTTTMTATARLTMVSPIMTVPMVHWIVRVLLLLLKTNRYILKYVKMAILGQQPQIPWSGT